MTAVTKSDEYADVYHMFRHLQSLDVSGTAYKRQHEMIIERTLPLAEHVAQRFRGRGQEHDDLFQAASLGLVNAVKRFNPELGTPFVAFAVPTIMGEVRRHFRDHGWALKVPRRIKELQPQLVQARSELAQRSGRAPTPTELARHLDIDRETVVDATIASSNYSTLSTDAPVGGQDGDGATLSAGLGLLDVGLDKVVDVETVRPLIAALPERERDVLMLRFFGDMTQSQIAEHLGISQMHVSRLLTRTLQSLRNQALYIDGDSASSEFRAQSLSAAGKQPRRRARTVEHRHILTVASTPALAS
ncbi:SigB/SigF/SigG family RNA polymerase sigma factor [Mycolicibacterium psychrotolerans]|uniref:SigB/SigF/SigG family RNA polymerase sigma factor n=1 Tax=Mycolicibacterium psychrotolerans TaxID=216929 RepID=UPI003D66FEC0